MISTYPIRFSSSLFSILLIFGLAFSQKKLDATTTLLLQEQMMRGSKEQSALLDKIMRDRSSALGVARETTDTVTDSDMFSDSAGTTVMLPPDTSIYESLVKGDTLNPDEIIEHITIFGHDVFKRDQGQSLYMGEQVAVPADYPIGAGDEVIVSLWGRLNEEHRLTVDRNGRVSLPRIGPISVAGLSFEKARDRIVDKIQAIEGVRASVAMGALHSVRVFVVGEVMNPGQYTVSALSNPTNALFAAGGVTKRGSLRNIELRRNGRRVAGLDFYDFLLKGNNFNSIALKPGDVLFVPVVKKMAAIAGNVRRSALYELKGKSTLADLVSLGGGFTPAAWVNRIQVDRFNNNLYQSILDVEAPSADEIPDFEIQDGDIVRVFHIVFKDQNAVFLSGNVRRPGKHEYKEGMRISDIVGGFDNILPETYLDYAVIYRRQPPTLDERIISFSLIDVLNDITSEENLLLEPYDKIVVYSRDYFEPDRTVKIDGAVTTPGIYRIVDNMRIKDLILVAGGLTDASSSERGELYRRVYDGDTVSTQKQTFCVQCAMKDDDGHNLVLRKLDQVFVRQKRGWEEAKCVTLTGEVVYPGDYVVMEGESLGDLLERAGGFTSDAYLAASIFTRESVKELERKRMEDYARQLEAELTTVAGEIAGSSEAGNLTMLLTQQKAMLERLQATKPVGRVVIDFESWENYEDLQLEDGDVLYVPNNLNTVSVIGEIFNPATFVLDSRNSAVNDLVQMAGGYKENANKKNTYVIKASGSVRTRRMVRIKRYKLAPGDAVVVPVKLPQSAARFRMFMETTQAIFSITTNSLLIASTILQIQRSAGQ